MKRAGIYRTRGINILFGTLLLLSLCLFAWREYSHRKVLQHMDAALAILNNSGSLLQAELDQKSATLETVSGELSESHIERESLIDRIANLEAQRDHLRLDNDNKLQRVKSLETMLESMELRLSDANHKVLELQTLPSKLTRELVSANNRLEELQSQMDEQAGLSAAIPESYAYEGTSSDGSVFALSGTPPQMDDLPQPVYLCNLNGIILEGWIHRASEEALFGHVGNWRQPASALVKGEKVFMLPKSNHEKRD